jgi:hypothetical protein
MEGAELVDCVAKKCYPPNLFYITADDAFSKDAHKAMVEATMEIESEVGEGDVDYEATKQAAIIMRWAADLGPYTRRVFNPEKGYGEVNNALFELNSLSFSLIANIALNETTSGSNFEHSHRLVAVSTCADYKSTNLTPASKAIARKIIDFERKDTMTHVLSLLGQVQGAREGLIFEPYAHHKLSIGGEWEMKKLTALGDVCDKLILPVDMKTVTISNEEILSEHSDDDHPACSQATYYRPESTSFPVVDGWTSDWFFQMTVSEKHPLKTGSRLFKALKVAGLKPKGIVFVVPKRMYESFNSAQDLVKANGKDPNRRGRPAGGWNTIAQYVVGIDI